jgi:putative ABC transport system substrate-binding protein
MKSARLLLGIVAVAGGMLHMPAYARATEVTVTEERATPPLEKQIDLIRKLVPQAKRVGMVYNPANPASVAVVKQMRELLPKAGMSLSEATAPQATEVGAAARNLIGKVDVIYTTDDSNVVLAYESIVKVGENAKIPLIADDIDGVKRGAAAALGVVAGNKLALYVNPDAAAKQGVIFSDAIIKSASEIIR